MAADTEKLDAALRENMKKRKVQQQARRGYSKTASVPPHESLEPPPKPA